MNIINKVFRKILITLSGNNIHLKRFLYDKELEIHLTTNSTANSILGKHVSLYPPYRIHDSVIGDFTYVSENAIMLQTTVGRFCSIGPRLMCGFGIHPPYALSTSPMFYSTAKQNGFTLSATDKIEERKAIKIGNDVFIGMNVTILDGVTIGDGAIIGAGSVVSKDIPPYAIAVGSPINILKKRFSDDQIAALLEIKWWNFEKEQLQEVEQMLFNVDAFINKYRKKVPSEY